MPRLEKRRSPSARWLLVVAWILSSPVAAQERTREQLDGVMRVELGKLAEQAEQAGRPDDARLARDWLFERDPRRLYLYLPDLPSEPASQADGGDHPTPSPPPASADVGGAADSAWRAQFLELRRLYARQLYELARRTAGADPTAAYQLLHEVLREAPDHEDARRMLGYRRDAAGQWSAGGPVQATLMTRPSRHVQMEARQHWRVLTPHFDLLTDTDEPTGRAIAAQLETLHAAWRQLFYSHWGDGAELTRLFAGETPRASTRRHLVVLLSSRDRYVSLLLPKQPRIELTIGIYLDELRTSYFYLGDDPYLARSTWLHEATHQLFFESTRVSPAAGRRREFWALEGVALLMESLRVRREGAGAWATVGGVDAERLQFARYHAVTDRWHVPLAELGGLGRQALQDREDIRRLYAECAGLANFLMTSSPRRRAAFLKLLEAIHQGRESDGLLARECGESLETLDQRYRDDLVAVEDRDLRFAASPRKLCLNGTRVTDDGLRVLDHVGALDWLDVADTQVTDAGLAVLKDAGRLRHLRVEGTAAGAATIALAPHWPALEELDLARTRLDAAALAPLSQAPRLETLWLTGTPIGDEALPILSGLKTLKSLDLSGTRLTEPAVRQLRAALPLWK